MNPISRDWGVMRTMMTPSITRCMAYNINRGTKNHRVLRKKVFFQEDERIRRLVALTLRPDGQREKEYSWKEKHAET